ncbi:MAG: hypothetical protein ACRCTR_00835 [Actinomycetota bacterium]
MTGMPRRPRLILTFEGDERVLLASERPAAVEGVPHDVAHPLVGGIRPLTEQIARVHPLRWRRVCHRHPHLRRQT